METFLHRLTQVQLEKWPLNQRERERERERKKNSNSFGELAQLVWQQEGIQHLRNLTQSIQKDLA